MPYKILELMDLSLPHSLLFADEEKENQLSYFLTSSCFLC